MVPVTPSINVVKIYCGFKNMTARWRKKFFYVNISETFLSEIARPSKNDNTSCLKSLALEP